ncbi:MAG: TVP38/TMEM64 family protein [Spirochaetota bacterium]|nr:TVP38/TMEM64 family protein [Spirochaetota bacterium]
MNRIKGNRKCSVIRLFVLSFIVIGVILLFRFGLLSLSDFTPTNIKNYILQFGVLSPIVFIIIYSLRAVILVLPVGVMSLAGGLAFGKWWGTLFILIGATSGSCLSFLIARYFGRSFIENFAWLHKGRIKSFDEGTEKHGFRFILFLRLIPLFQYDAVNFGSGLSRMKFRDYALGSFIGMIPGGFINAMLGSSLEDIISVQFFAALSIFVLMMFIPAIFKSIKKRREHKLEIQDTS